MRTIFGLASAPAAGNATQTPNVCVCVYLCMCGGSGGGALEQKLSSWAAPSPRKQGHVTLPPPYVAEPKSTEKGAAAAEGKGNPGGSARARLTFPPLRIFSPGAQPSWQEGKQLLQTHSGVSHIPSSSSNSYWETDPSLLQPLQHLPRFPPPLRCALVTGSGPP